MQRVVAFGPYSLVERIGLGGRSEVYRAVRRSPSGDEWFAVKRALAGAVHDRETQSVLFGEAEILGKFQHRGIVRVRDFGSMTGVAFVAYELVEGHDLETVLKRARDTGTKLSMDAALTIALEITEALHYVHGFRDGTGGDRPIVHRDVGPSNVLIGFDGSVKLADFGIAKVPGRNSTTGVGEIKGTIRYMSPEQVSGDEVDARSDLYGLGAVLLEMTTGRLPFEGLKPVEVLQALARGAWLDPDGAAPFLPGPLKEVLRKVLAPKPAGRYDTSEKLLEGLRGLVQKLGVHIGAKAVAHAMGELFPARGSQDKTLEESRDMAEEKGGSDLDVFEGLAKKSVRPSNLPGSLPPSNAPGGPPSGRASGLPAPVPPPPSLRSGVKATLLGVPAPAVPGAPPTSTPLPLPPPASIKPTVKTMAGVATPLPPPSGPPPSTATPPPIPSGRPATATPLPPPPPTSAKIPSAPPKPANTLVAAVPPPPKPAVSIGSAVGMPSTKTPAPPAAKDDGVEEKTPPAGTAIPAKSKGANVDMDWADEEESTHVFEKRRHAMNKEGGPRPAAGAPPAPLPPPAARGAGATLVMTSGGQAAPRSVPPPVAPPQPKTVINEPLPAAVAAAPPTATPIPYRRPSDEATVVRPREGSSGRLALVLAALALIAVVGAIVFMVWPRKGDLKITLKSKSGQQIAKADIYVDGKKKCETTPCLVSDLEAGSRTVKVIINDEVVAEESHKVAAGGEEFVTITVDTGSEKPAPTQTPSTVASMTSSAPPVAPMPEGTGFKISGPAEVKVFVDGKERGVLGGAPVTLTDLTPGEHKLKLDGGDHYKTVEKTIAITKGKVDDLGEHKPPVTKGLLTVDLKTEGAQLLLVGTKDGKKTEKKLEEAQAKKLSIPADETWKITATKKGYEDFSEEIKFEDGAYQKTMTVELAEKGKPKPPPVATVPPTTTTGRPPPPPPPTVTPPSGMGTLSVNSVPISNAILDGRPIGKTPIGGLSVTAGKHTVTFKHPEKGTKSVTVDVKPGGKATAAVKFD